MNFTNLISEKQAFRKRKSATAKVIMEAEKLLGVKFAEEYKEYLSNFGSASIYGHEFTGICDIERVNVVDVTKEERKLNTFVSQEFYVVEQLNIDGIVIWQSRDGSVFMSMPSNVFKKINESLSEYIN